MSRLDESDNETAGGEWVRPEAEPAWSLTKQLKDANRQIRDHESLIYRLRKEKDDRDFALFVVGGCLLALILGIWISTITYPNRKKDGLASPAAPVDVSGLPPTVLLFRLWRVARSSSWNHHSFSAADAYHALQQGFVEELTDYPILVDFRGINNDTKLVDPTRCDALYGKGSFQKVVNAMRFEMESGGVEEKDRGR